LTQETRVPNSFDDVASTIHQSLDAGAKPEEAVGYWECFASLVAVGWTDTAVDLAGLSSELERALKTISEHDLLVPSG